MGGRRWWLGAMVFGAVVAMAATSTHLGTGQEQGAVVLVAVPPSSAPVSPVVPTTSETSTPAPTTIQAPEPSPVIEPAKPGNYLDVAGDIELGVVVRDRQTGEDLVSQNPDQRFDSASLVKVLIALEALGTGSQDPAEVSRMLSTSDDDAASRMWSTGGGNRIVTKWVKRLGLTGTAPPADPNRWGDTQTTAADMAAVYLHLFESPDGDTVISALDAMTDYGEDGFDQRFGIPAAADGRRWAVKQGWACCRNGRVLHTTGLVGDDQQYVVVVLTAQPASTTSTAARAKVTEITAALLTEL
ncbi:MAG: serine hydrolase [Umezawaea sp.]